MHNFDLKLEDRTNIKFVRVQAKDATEALSKAIKKYSILNPTNVFLKQEDGTFKVFNF